MLQSAGRLVSCIIAISPDSANPAAARPSTSSNSHKCVGCHPVVLLYITHRAARDRAMPILNSQVCLLRTHIAALKASRNLPPSAVLSATGNLMRESKMPSSISHQPRSLNSRHSNSFQSSTCRGVRSRSVSRATAVDAAESPPAAWANGVLFSKYFARMQAITECASCRFVGAGSTAAKLFTTRGGG